MIKKITAALLITSALSPAYADGLTPAAPAAAGICYASGSSGPTVPCTQQDQTWVQLLRPNDPADKLTVGGTAITAIFGSKAPLASPTFSGTVTAPDLSVSSTSGAANVTAARLRSLAAPSGTSSTSLRVEKGDGYGGEIAGYLTQGVGAGLRLSAVAGSDPIEVLRLDNTAAATFAGAITAPRLSLTGTGSVGDASAMSASPDAAAAVDSLGRSVFEALRGTTFFLRPFLTNLTCSQDQTANITAALALAPPGAEIVAPPGCILTSSTITITAQTLRGVSASRDGGTEIRYSGASGPALKLMRGGARASRLRITCTANRDTSIATAIQLSDGEENPRGQRLDGIAATDCYDQIDVQSGEMWSAQEMDLYRAKRWGFRIRNGFNADSGDGSISNSLIYTDVVAGGKAAIRLESGGGLKLTTVKTLQFYNCFDLAVADGAATSILEIPSGNSFENPESSECIRLGRIEGGTTGTYKNIQIGAQVTGSIGTYPGVSNVTLSPNTSNVPYGLTILGGDNINVSPSMTLQDVEHGIVIRDPATNVRVGQFACVRCKSAVEDQRLTGQGSINRTETRNVDLPQSGSYTNLYQLELAPYSGSKISTTVQGIVQNIGTVNTEISQLATRGDAGVAMTEASRTIAGSPLDVTFDTSKAGYVIVGVRPNAAAGGGNFQGTVTITVAGRIAGFSVLQ